MLQDVRLAAKIGIDGFFLNMWTDSDTNNGGVWTRCVTLVNAASEVGNFHIMPNFDMSIIGGSGSSDTAAQDLLLRMLSKLKGKSALRRLADGRHVVGAFRAEARAPAFYNALKSRAANELQMNLYIVSVFLGTGSTTLFSNYAPVSDSFAGWGTAIPTSASFVSSIKAQAAAVGKSWMHPVSNQDFRPYNFCYWEAKNSLTLRSHWESVITSGTQIHQLTQ